MLAEQEEGFGLEDRRGEHVEPSVGSSRDDSSAAKAIGGVVSDRPCSIRRDYGDRR